LRSTPAVVTAAAQDLAEVLARVLALDGAIGSQYSEIVDGVYTGRPTGLFVYHSEKAVAIEQLAAREGIDLAASYAYSDSESDLPMLRAVGNAVVVNPDAQLRRIALEQGWEIVELDRLGRRLKMLVALGIGTALASAGRALIERSGAPRARGRGTAADSGRPRR